MKRSHPLPSFAPGALGVTKCYLLSFLGSPLNSIPTGEKAAPLSGNGRHPEVSRRPESLGVTTRDGQAHAQGPGEIDLPAAVVVNPSRRAGRGRRPSRRQPNGTASSPCRGGRQCSARVPTAGLPPTREADAGRRMHALSPGPFSCSSSSAVKRSPARPEPPRHATPRL